MHARGPLLVLLAVALTHPLVGQVPRAVRLDNPSDRQAFRGWFTLIAEFEALRPPQELPSEIVDCAALLRYSYRNALARHTSEWSATTGILPLRAPGAVRKYHYPSTPLRANLFRVRPGPYATSFAAFADANRLRQFNTVLVSRDVRAAQPGDLLFYRQLAPGEADGSQFHSMIFVGHSHWIEDAAGDWVVYDTGPVGAKPGVMKRVRIEELMAYPDPAWRPVTGNANFLGVFRWSILEDGR